MPQCPECGKTVSKFELRIYHGKCFRCMIRTEDGLKSIELLGIKEEFRMDDTKRRNSS